MFVYDRQAQERFAYTQSKTRFGLLVYIYHINAVIDWSLRIKGSITCVTLAVNAVS